MSEITAAKIKELRESSGAGMMDCKKALTEANGDMEGAVDWLRKKGLAAAAKKSGRVAAEGLVALAQDGSKAALIELNSETDFVARNEQFQKLASQIASYALTTGEDLDALLAHECSIANKPVKDAVTDAIATIGENLNLRRVAALDEKDGVVATYLHNAVAEGLGKIGVLVSLKSDGGDQEKLREFGKKIAMHVAAAQPEALTRDEVPSDRLDRERQVLIDQAVASGKPQEIAEKMVEGRIRKFYEEIVLPEQVFVMDGKAKVSEAMDEASKEIGGKITLTGFRRLTLGEGVEKEEDDFAAEVAKAANG
jgi:elongation factor Ts